MMESRSKAGSGGKARISGFDRPGPGGGRTEAVFLIPELDLEEQVNNSLLRLGFSTSRRPFALSRQVKARCSPPFLCF